VGWDVGEAVVGGPHSPQMVTIKPPRPLELLPALLLALAPGLASGALVFEAANQVFNFPGAPRSDPVSWGFPAEDARTAMALAGSVSGGAWAGSTDGGSSWTRTHIQVPEALSVAVGGSDRQTRMAVTGNGVPNGWTGRDPSRRLLICSCTPTPPAARSARASTPPPRRRSPGASFRRRR